MINSTPLGSQISSNRLFDGSSPKCSLEVFYLALEEYPTHDVQCLSVQDTRP